MVGGRILLLLGCIAYSNAWKVGQQLEYSYRGTGFASIYDLKDSFSISELKGKLIIQAVDEETLTVQLTGVSAASQALYDGNPYLVGNYDFTLGSDAQKLTISDSQSLERPFQIKHKNGAVQSIQVAAADPVWAVNVKKSIASTIQLDIKSITDESMFYKEILYGNEAEANRVVDVTENSILGNCLTAIKVIRLPGAQVITNKNYNVVQKYCAKGSPVYELHKQVDLDSCSNRPVLNSVMPPVIACKPGHSKCGNGIEHAAGARYYACKVPEGGWKVIRGDYFNDYLVSPFGSKSERLFTGGAVSVILTGSGAIATQLEAPADPVVHNSLAYGFLEAVDASGNLSQPKFEDAPLTRPADILSKKNDILQIVRDVADQLSRNAAESTSDDFDFANRLIEVRRYAAQLKLSEICNIASSVEKEETITVRNLLIDVLATTGTPATAKFVADLLRKGELGNWPTKSSAADVAMMLFNYVNLPTKELLTDLLDLVKTLETGQVNTDVHTTSLMGMAELLYHACASSFLEERRFPTRAYGSFCSVEDPVYKGFVAYLEELLGKASSNFETMAIITVAGTLGTKDAFPLLLPYIRGVKNQQPAIRTRAILALHRYAYSAPEKVIPVVSSLYDNSAENPEVRMAALAILLNSNAPYSTWQKVAWQTYFEQNNQVAAFTSSLISNLAALDESNALYSALVKKAKAAAQLMKVTETTTLLSRSSHFAKWLTDYDAGAIAHVPIWKTGYQQGPVASGLRIALQLGPHVFTYFQIYRWSYGFEEVTEKVRQAFAKPVKQSRPREINFAQADLDALYQKLGVKKRVQEEINTFFQVGLLGNMHRLGSLDEIDKTLPKAIKEISEAISKKDGYDVKMQKIRSWTDVLISLPTVIGVPTTYEGSFPSIQSTDVNVKGYVNSHRDFSVSFDGNTLFSWAWVAKLSISFPFTNSFVAAGVERKSQVKAPRNVGFALNVKDATSVGFSVELTPAESKRTLLLNKVTPFLLAGRTDEFLPTPQKAGYSIVHTKEAVTKNLSPSPLLPITVTSERSEEVSDKSSDPLDRLLSNIYPKTLKYHELKLAFSPLDTKLPKLKIAFQTARARKYYAGNFTYIESGTGSQAPRPRASVVGGYDLEADSEIAGGYSFNQKLALSVGDNEVVALNLNVAQDFDHSLRKTVLTLKSREYTGCVKLRQEVPVFSVFENSPADLQTKISVQLGKGEDCSETAAKGEILLSRSDKQLEHARATPQYTTCATEMAAGITDSKDCTAARRLADTYDKVSIKLDGYGKSDLLKKIVSFLANKRRARLSGKYTVKEIEDDGALSMEATFSKDGKKYSLVARHDGEEATYNNVPVLLTTVFPLTARKNLWDYFNELAVYGAKRPICHVSANRVQTFDGVTYDYTIDECQHLVASDCSGKEKFAILLSRESQGNFAVRVITKGDRFEISSSGVVDLNKKKKINLDESGISIFSSDSMIATLYKRKTGDYVFVREGATFAFYFRGSMVTIKAGMGLPGRLCGLCGDNNYEQAKEFSDPKRCAVSSGALMAASFRVDSGNCPPLPADVQEALKEHRDSCQSVDEVIRSALPILNDSCKFKKSKNGLEGLVCSASNVNGNGNGHLGG